MSDPKEFSGKTLDEAIQMACDHFKLERGKLEIEIMSGGSTGIFGLVGVKKASIKARPRGKFDPLDKPADKPNPTDKPKSDEKPKAADKPKRGSKPKAKAKPEPTAEAKAEDKPAAETEAKSDDKPARSSRSRGRGRGRGKAKAKPDAKPEAKEEAKPEASAEPAPFDDFGGGGWDGTDDLDEPNGNMEPGPGNRDGRGQRGKGRGGRGRSRGAKPEKRPEPNGNKARPDRAERPIQDISKLDRKVLESTVRQVVARLLGDLVQAPQLSVRIEKDKVLVSIEDEENSGLIIGREGQTLAALQYLTTRIVSRHMDASVRVQLDTGDYRERQNDKLREMAHELAAKSVSTGKVQSTRPMSSYHRRVVHLALQDAPGVTTRSKGEGPTKRVLILPKRTG